jgi:cytochrome c-type biogenesis protein CcmH/NrfG
VEQGKHSDAEAALREAIRLEPAHRWARYHLSRALVGQGKTMEAEAMKEVIRDLKWRELEKSQKPE